MYEQIQESLLREQEKRRRLQKDMAQGTGYDPYRQVSGRTVPYHWAQGLTELGKALIQKNSMNSSDERTEGLNKEFTQGREDATGQLNDLYFGREESGLDQANMQEAMDADPVKAAIFAKQNPYLKNIDSTMQAQAYGGNQGRGAYWDKIIDDKGRLHMVNKRDPNQIKDMGINPAKWSYGANYTKSNATQQGSKDVDKVMNPQIKRAETLATKGAEREFNMEGVTSALDLAESLISGKQTGTQPTGSGIGEAYDYISAIVGYSPDGAKESQQLQAIGAALTGKMPRFEGPQSDYDRDYYEKMAGRLADPGTPNDRKLEALKAVRYMWAKYEKIGNLEPEFNTMPSGYSPENKQKPKSGMSDDEYEKQKKALGL